MAKIPEKRYIICTIRGKYHFLVALPQPKLKKKSQCETLKHANEQITKYISATRKGNEGPTMEFFPIN